LVLSLSFDVYLAKVVTGMACRAHEAAGRCKM
jgi:hypothetical protein